MGRQSRRSELGINAGGVAFLRGLGEEGQWSESRLLTRSEVAGFYDLKDCAEEDKKIDEGGL